MPESPTWTVGVESATSKVMRIFSVGTCGASVVISAPQMPACGRSALTTYMPRSSGIAHTNSLSAVVTGVSGSVARS